MAGAPSPDRFNNFRPSAAGRFRTTLVQVIDYICNIQEINIAVTIGMRDIMASRHIEGVFYCGHWQRTVFRRTLFQEPTVEYPGTFLKTHKSFGVSIDAVTASPPEAKPF